MVWFSPSNAPVKVATGKKPAPEFQALVALASMLLPSA